MSEPRLLSHQLTAYLQVAPGTTMPLEDAVAGVELAMIRDGLWRSGAAPTQKISPDERLAHVAGNAPLNYKQLVAKIVAHTQPIRQPARPPDSNEVSSEAARQIQEWLKEYRTTIALSDKELGAEITDRESKALDSLQDDLARRIKTAQERVVEAEYDLARLIQNSDAAKATRQRWYANTRNYLQDEIAAVEKAWGEWDVDALVKFGAINARTAADLKAAIARDS